MPRLIIIEVRSNHMFSLKRENRLWKLTINGNKIYGCYTLQDCFYIINIKLIEDGFSESIREGTIAE